MAADDEGLRGAIVSFEVRVQRVFVHDSIRAPGVQDRIGSAPMAPADRELPALLRPRSTRLTLHPRANTGTGVPELRRRPGESHLYRATPTAHVPAAKTEHRRHGRLRGRFTDDFTSQPVHVVRPPLNDVLPGPQRTATRRRSSSPSPPSARFAPDAMVLIDVTRSAFLVRRKGLPAGRRPRSGGVDVVCLDVRVGRHGSGSRALQSSGPLAAPALRCSSAQRSPARTRRSLQARRTRRHPSGVGRRSKRPFRTRR